MHPIPPRAPGFLRAVTGPYEIFTVAGAALSGVQVLEGLSPAARDEVAARCQGRRYAAGATVVSASADDDEVYFILSGTLRANLYSNSGKEVTFRDQEAGQMFGEISAIDGQPRSANVIALEDVALAALPREAFIELVCGNPALAHGTLSHLALLVRSLSDRVMEFSTLGVRSRIQNEILRIALRAGQGARRVVLSPAPRHSDIASRVSTHREAVSREIGELVRAGVMQRSGQSLVIPDVEALEMRVRELARNAPE